MKSRFTIIISVLVIWLLPGCMADIRTPLIKQDGITEANAEKGKLLLEKAWKLQGLDKLKEHETYLLRGRDVWKGLMGKMGKPWPDAEVDLQFRYAVGTFDGEVGFLSGKRAGTSAGLQSWNYYEVASGEAAVFTDYDERIAFGLSAYQYFFELADRLKRAPIISYAGEKEFRGQPYDQVFVTWETPEPHQEHDQYVLWINRASGLLEYAVYTLRDNYLKMPGARAFYGSIQFADWREVEGIRIPHRQIVYLNQPKQKEKKHLHQMQVQEFGFDTFPVEMLYPNPELDRIGDDKVVME